MWTISLLQGSRKPRSVSKNDARSSNSNKSSQSLVADGGSSSANGLHAEPAIPDGSNLTQKIGDLPLPITSPVVSQHLPPIGTPTLHTDAQADKRSMNPKYVLDHSANIFCQRFLLLIFIFLLQVSSVKYFLNYVWLWWPSSGLDI